MCFLQPQEALMCAVRTGLRPIFALFLTFTGLAGGDESASVPFPPRKDGAVIVPVTVDGTVTLNFLLDTGAAGSTVVETVADRLGLVPAARSLVTTPTSREWLPVVKVGRLTVGAASVDGLLATTVPHSAVEALLGHIDGILGQDFLSRFNYTLDYRNHRVHWDPETGTLDEPFARLGLAWVDGRFLVELPQNDGALVRLVPDSGSDVMVVFVRPGRPTLPMEGGSTRAELRGFGSQRGVQIRMLRGLTIGATTLKNRPAAVVERLEPNAPDYDGLLPLHMFASVSFNSLSRYLIVREH
jgi:hypothetical protein